MVFLSFVEQIIDTHLDGDQLAILRPMDRLQHHGPAPLGFCPKFWPLVRLKVRIQIVDGHGAQFVFRITQHEAGRLVDIQNPGSLIDPVHGVSGSFHRKLRKPQGSLCLLLLADIKQRCLPMGDRSRLSVHGKALEMDPVGSAGLFLELHLTGLSHACLQDFLAMPMEDVLTILCHKADEWLSDKLFPVHAHQSCGS